MKTSVFLQANECSLNNPGAVEAPVLEILPQVTTLTSKLNLSRTAGVHPDQRGDLRRNASVTC